MLSLGRLLQRSFSTAVTESEKKIVNILKEKIKEIQFLSVQDISNGCGSMYSIEIKAGEFTGLTKVAQHRLVTAALKKEIGDMHGLIINTKTI